MNRNEKITEFSRLLVNVFVSRVYERTIAGTTKLLNNGPQWKNPPEDLTELNRWFDSLDSKEKGLLLSLARYSIKMSVFNTLTYFDGVQSGADIVVDERVSDFSIYFQQYDTEEDRWENNFIMQERISGIQFQDYLHDLYTDALAKKTE